jgi:23S rRNA (pseudouridine1915-N3)-methyltransferase
VNAARHEPFFPLRLHLTVIGKLKSGPERILVEDYVDRTARIGRAAGFASITVHELAESKARSPDLRRRDESHRLLAALPPGAFIIVLDERGKPLSSGGLAQLLRRRTDSGLADLAFVIGGPDGLSRELIDEAGLALSLGPMTWPHRLVRVMLAEQIYRSVTILLNHPYHRP